MEYTKCQERVFNNLRDWFFNESSRKNNSFIISGYAGTGKTFLISEFINYLLKLDENKKSNKKYKIAAIAFTGKAANVLKEKLPALKETVPPTFSWISNYIGTIHSFIYRPKIGREYNEHTQRFVNKIISWDFIGKEILETYDIIFIDEASMINTDIFYQLESINIKKVYVGDHGQLPPVKSDFNIFDPSRYDNDNVLTEVVRTEKDSPILKLATKVLKEGRIEETNKVYSKDVFKLNWGYYGCQKLWKNLKYDDETIILCHSNKLRVSLNKEIRKKLEFNIKTPYPGERIVCLKNNHDLGIMNGQLFKISFHMPSSSSYFYNFDIMDEMQNVYSVVTLKEIFNKANHSDIILNEGHEYPKEYLKKEFPGMGSCNFFDFGYAITVHKSQGSEWDKVILIDNEYIRDETFYSKWLYTAITRAKKKLLIINNIYLG